MKHLLAFLSVIISNALNSKEHSEGSGEREEVRTDTGNITLPGLKLIIIC
jgi:hypothetical protein